MNTCLIFKRFRLSFSVRRIGLAVLWGIGLLLGVFLYMRFSPLFALDWNHFISEGYNLKILSISLPIVMVTLSVYFDRYGFCYPLFLAEGIARGFCSAALFGIFGYGAWLLRGLALFSGMCTSVVMWWLLLRTGNATGSCMIRAVVICIGVICFLDFLVISPFLSGLSIYF